MLNLHLGGSITPVGKDCYTRSPEDDSEGFQKIIPWLSGLIQSEHVGLSEIPSTGSSSSSHIFPYLPSWQGHRSIQSGFTQCQSPISRVPCWMSLKCHRLVLSPCQATVAPFWWFRARRMGMAASHLLVVLATCWRDGSKWGDGVSIATPNLGREEQVGKIEDLWWKQHWTNILLAHFSASFRGYIATITRVDFQCILWLDELKHSWGRTHHQMIM